MNRVIIPKTYITNIKKPLIFLAGPIKGAPNWQDVAIETILSKDPDIIIASPRREIRDKTVSHILQGDDTHFPRQRAWERYYLDIASKTGAILFWLPKEELHDCKKVYGAMTRIELGQWMTHFKYDKSVRFCIGSDGAFPELDTIEYDLSLDVPDKEIKTSLETTCQEAIQLARTK